MTIRQFLLKRYFLFISYENLHIALDNSEKFLADNFGINGSLYYKIHSNNTSSFYSKFKNVNNFLKKEIKIICKLKIKETIK